MLSIRNGEFMEIVLDENAVSPLIMKTEHGIRLVMNPRSDISVVLSALERTLPESLCCEIWRLLADPACERSFETGSGWVRIYESRQEN